MTRLHSLARLVALAGGLASTAAPVIAAGAAGLNLVNGTGRTMTSLFIRRTGTQGWSALPATPPKPGRGAKATSPFTDPDCAFDLKATLDDEAVVQWTGVNLCEVHSVTLNRNESGVTWVDYD